MPRSLQEVVFVDGVRTPFGKAGEKGMYAQTRADDLVIKCIRELDAPPPRAAQGAHRGGRGRRDDADRRPGPDPRPPRRAALRAAQDHARLLRRPDVRRRDDRRDQRRLVDRVRRHRRRDRRSASSTWAATPWARASTPTRGSSPSASSTSRPSSWASTAENLHDRFPHLTKERCDAYAVNSQRKLAAAYAAGKVQPDLVPVATRHVEKGWGLATVDEPPRPGTTLDELAGLKTPFRPHGNVTAGNAAGLNDGATACILASESAAAELGLPVRMRLVSYAFVGVEPEVMGIGPVPAAEKALRHAGLTHRGHRALRAQRGVRRAGHRLPRPLRHRRRRRAGQPLGRRHRDGPPARVLRRAPHDPARPPLRGAPRGALRPHRHVHRHRHGRLRRLGEPPPRRLRDRRRRHRRDRRHRRPRRPEP